MRRIAAATLLLILGARAFAAEPTLVVLTETGALIVLRADRPGVPSLVVVGASSKRIEKVFSGRM